MFFLLAGVSKKISISKSKQSSEKCERVIKSFFVLNRHSGCKNFLQICCLTKIVVNTVRTKICVFKVVEFYLIETNKAKPLDFMQFLSYYFGCNKMLIRCLICCYGLYQIYVNMSYFTKRNVETLKYGSI